MQALPSLRQPYHKNTPPVIPVGLDGSTSRYGWPAAVKKELCDSNDSLSLFVFWSVFIFLSPLSAFLSVFLHPHPSAPPPSLCPHWLPDEGKLMPEFIEKLGLLPASLGSSARLHVGGACCLKGTAFLQPPLLLSRLLLRAAVNTPSLSPLTQPI